MKPFQTHSGQEAAYTLEKVLPIMCLTHRERRSCMLPLTCKANLDSPIKLIHMSVYCSRKLEKAEEIYIGRACRLYSDSGADPDCFCCDTNLSTQHYMPCGHFNLDAALACRNTDYTDLCRYSI